jgi:hypothetical protein
MDNAASWLAPIPVTSRPAVSYADGTLDAIDAANRRIVHGRTILTRRYRQSQQLAHGVTDATDVILPTRWYHLNALDNLNMRLTAAQRDVIRFIRNSEVRSSLASAGVSMPENPVAVEHQTPTSSRLPKGLINGTEARVNVRGAYGKRGIRGTMAQVSQRDNRLPSWLLKQVQTVGVATHPEADAADYDALLLYLRTHRKQATLRLYADAADSTGTVVSAWRYGMPDDDADADSTRKPVKQAAPVMPEVTRFAALAGAQVGID